MNFGVELLNNLIKSPLNYIGGKYKILPQILPHFPNNIRIFVDLFTGGANVGINVDAEEIILNDNLIYLMEIHKSLFEISENNILSYIDKIINKFNLSLTNTEGYNKLRNQYNKLKNPLDLLILSFYSFNHQIRFNSNHNFNTPFGKNRSRYNDNIKKNLIAFINRLQQKNIVFMKENFDKINFSELTAKDFVYCDPPYLITVGTYNDGRRGFNGWNIEQEKNFLIF
ncbi:MAG: DNA adenine methylase [Treponema sp.]|nr:DNA adenine methylase [Treponema sp.]